MTALGTRGYNENASRDVLVRCCRVEPMTGGLL